MEPFFFQIIFGRLFWSINHEIYTKCKGQQAFSNFQKKPKMEIRGFVPTAVIHNVCALTLALTLALKFVQKRSASSYKQLFLQHDLLSAFRT